MFEATGVKENDELFIKYLVFKFIKILDADPQVRWCPRVGCENFVRNEGCFTVKLKCKCGQEICFKCGREFHGRFFLNCNKRMDE